MLAGKDFYYEGDDKPNFAKAKIYIDDQLCAETPDSTVEIEHEAWNTYKCPEGGIMGSYIKIEKESKGDHMWDDPQLKICGLRVMSDFSDIDESE